MLLAIRQILVKLGHYLGLEGSILPLVSHGMEDHATSNLREDERNTPAWICE